MNALNSGHLGQICKNAPSQNYLHFRKWISRKLILNALAENPKLKQISLSRYASQRLSQELKELLEQKQIAVRVSRNRGRPPIMLQKIEGGARNDSG